jgi:hypothetical protein
MQEWLRANGQFAPDTSSWRTMTMHGMLTAGSSRSWTAARGPAFDRLFLELMIRHHEGALQMVKDLFATPRAGQDVDVSTSSPTTSRPRRRAEIGLMRQMLDRAVHAALASPHGGRVPRVCNPPESLPTLPSSSDASLAALAPRARALGAQTYPPGNDPRDGLKAGLHDAGEAAKGMRWCPARRKPRRSTRARPDLRELRSRLPRELRLPGQLRRLLHLGREATREARDGLRGLLHHVAGRPVDLGNLLFVSAEGAGNRNDCAQGWRDEPEGSHGGRAHLRRVQPARAALVKNVQTCKGSHTHTLVPHPKDKGVVYLYVSGSQGARPETELAGCKNGTDPADESNSLYRLDVIKVPLAQPAGRGGRDRRAHLHRPGSGAARAAAARARRAPCRGRQRDDGADGAAPARATATT